MKTTAITMLTQAAAHRSRLAMAGGSLLLLAAVLWLSSAQAQTQAPAPVPAAPETAAASTATSATPVAPLQVGDATRNLLEKQRSGALASGTARPIAGEVAQRSYERYLRSFERPIPESFTTVASPAGKSTK